MATPTTLTSTCKAINVLTVLTPTYNRARTLGRLFDSLLLQTEVNFEWLIVDDGSCDETAALVADFAKRAPFPIRYLFQVNGGKHVALNTGVAQARADWVCMVDSDDWLLEGALQEVVVTLARHDRKEIVGVCWRRQDHLGQVIGRQWPAGTPPQIMAPTQAGRRIQGDLAYVFRREVMLRTPFPVIPGEKFVPELYIWNQIADQGNIVFYLDRVVYCTQYLPDGYTMNFAANLRRNPHGFYLHYAAQIRREPHWLGKVKALVRATQCLVYRALRALHANRQQPS